MKPRLPSPDLTRLHPALFGGAVTLALLSVALALDYFHRGLFGHAALQAGLTISCALGADWIKQQRDERGVVWIGISLLATLVMLGLTFAGLEPALLIVILLAIPAAALQGLPPAMADRLSRLAVVAGLLLVGLLLLTPVAAFQQTGAQTAAPYIALLACTPFVVLLLREYPLYNPRAKLIISFFAVAVLPLGLLAYWNDQTARQDLTASVKLSLAAVARQTASHFDDYFNNAQNNLRAEAQLPEFREYLQLAPLDRPGSPLKPEVAALMEVLKNKDSHVSEYLLIDGAGVVVAATSTIDVGKVVVNQDYFRTPFNSAQPYISPVYFFQGAVNGSIFLSNQIFVAPAPIGVLVARYDATQVLQEQMEQTTQVVSAASSYAILLDETQMVLADGRGTEAGALYKLVGPVNQVTLESLRAAQRLPSNRRIEEAVIPIPALRARLDEAAFQPSFTAPSSPGDDRLNQVYVQPLQTRPWNVAFFQPQAAFLSSVEAQTRTSILFAIGMAGLVSLAALLLAQIIAGPITRLTQIAGRAAEGNLSEQAAVETGDEIGNLALSFNRMMIRLNELINSLEMRVSARTAQLQAVTDISRATASVRDLSQLLTLALTLIRDRFGFYHASIFLLDEAGEFAVLRESTGEAGRQLKARRHQLAVGSRSLVGRATRKREPVVVQDVTHDPTHFKNPLLPETRSEAVIPLLSGNRLIGALDVQSIFPSAFGDNDIQILQTLADQLSIAIENAELFERTQSRLREMSTLYQQVTGAGWHTLTRGQPSEIVYDLTPGGGNEPTPDPVAIPLELRGQTVGVIELQGRSAASLSPEERAVLEAVRAQLSVAFESAVLLEETQRRSRREQLINQVVYQIRSTLNPDTILQSSIRELGRALGATEVTVRLSPPQGRPEEATPHA